MVKHVLLPYMTMQEVFKLSLASKDVYQMVNYNMFVKEEPKHYQQFLEMMMMAQYNNIDLKNVFGPKNPSNLKKVFFHVKNSFDLRF